MATVGGIGGGGNVGQAAEQQRAAEEHFVEVAKTAGEAVDVAALPPEAVNTMLVKQQEFGWTDGQTLLYFSQHPDELGLPADAAQDTPEQSQLRVAVGNALLLGLCQTSEDGTTPLTNQREAIEAYSSAILNDARTLSTARVFAGISQDLIANLNDVNNAPSTGPSDPPASAVLSDAGALRAGKW